MVDTLIPVLKCGVIFSRAPFSGIDDSARLMSVFLIFLGRDISKTVELIFTKSSKKMANGLQQKSQAFGFRTLSGWERGSKRSLLPLSFRTQLRKKQHGGKTDLLVEKTV